MKIQKARNGLPEVGLDHDYDKYYKIGVDHRIVDLGATVGEWSIFNYDKLVKQHSFVLMVEPNIDIAWRIIQWMEEKRFKNGALLTAGIWHEPSIQWITRTGNPWLNMLEVHHHNNGMDVKFTMPVPIITIQKFV